MNKIILLGNMTRNPKTTRKTAEDGSEVVITKFDLAVNRRAKRDGEADADFFHCTSFGRQAEYELLDEPDLGPHTLYHNSNGEISSNNLTRAERKQQADLCAEENEQASSENNSDPAAEKETNDRYPLFGSNGNGNNANGSNANGGNNNKDYNINPDIKTGILNPNLNPYQDQEVIGEDYSMEFIVQHYELEAKYIPHGKEKQFNTVKDVLYDVLNTGKPIIRVMGEDKPAAVVKSRLLKLDRLDIDYAIEQYQKQVTKVHNHKAYMLTVLYQAKSQGELDISNQVMYDFYGAGSHEKDSGDG